MVMYHTRQLADDVGIDGFVEKSEGWQALLAQLERVIAHDSDNNINPQITQIDTD